MSTTAARSPEPLDAEAFRTMRHAMVASQLRTSAVNDPRVVVAMGRVPRELFVPDAERPFAYLDRQVALGRGRYLNVPVATGRLLTEAYLRPDDRVLLIGGATGYAAAVLAELVARVVAVEGDPELVAHARRVLGGYSNVELVEGPMPEGAPAGAPYDVLMIDGAVEFVPEPLLEQLHPGARIVAGVVEDGVVRLSSGRRSAGGYGLLGFADMDCVVLPGFSRPRRFIF